MKQIFTSILLASMSYFGFAQEPCASGRYASDVFSNVTVTSDIVYGSNLNFNGTTKVLKMDFYEPTGDTETKRPLIFWVHGGSFLGGTKTDGDMVTLANAFAKKGYVCASIDYRTGFFPIDSVNSIRAVLRAVHDLRAAVRFFYKDAANADIYNVDTNNIFVGGYSAGAITALHYAYLDKTCEVTESNYITQATLNQVGGFEGISGNPCYSQKIKGVINIAGALARYNWLESGDVPFVSIHGTSDATVGYNRQIVNPGVPLMYLDGSRMLHEQANDLGIDNPFYTFYGAGHGFYVGTSASALAYMDTTQNVITDFLVDMLGCSNPTLQALNTPAQTANLYTVAACTANVPFEDCTALSIEEEDLFDGLKVYPNPANDQLRISGLPGQSEILITDLNGRLISLNQVNTNDYDMAVSSMKSGIYLITITAHGVSTTQKLIIE
jgi:para-nitrobenzyl esterase